MLRSGFTLIELMVVLLITLVIMGLLTSFFITTTKVVSVVELKLRLTEQARGILDTLEEQIMNACANERGGQFVVKAVTYTDGDPDPRVSNNNNPTASTRKLDCLSFVQTAQTGKIVMAGYPFLGGYPYPLNRAPRTSETKSHEYGMNTLVSNIHDALNSSGAPNSLLHDINNADTSITAGGSGVIFEQKRVRGDVGRLNYRLVKREFSPNSMLNYTRTASDPDGIGGLYYYPRGVVPHQLEPGYEVGGTYSTQIISVNETFQWGSTPSGILNFEDVRVMDLIIAVWDETDRTYHRVPHLHAVYFAPIPKAILVTITVCESSKRGRITYSRIIRPPSGGGDGHFTTANTDTGTSVNTLNNKILLKYPATEATTNSTLFKGVLIADDKNNNHKLDSDETVSGLISLPLPYNRPKLLRTNTIAPDANDFEPYFLDTSVFDH